MTVVCGGPVRNREFVLEKHLKAVYELEHDKKDIILYYLVNDSVDFTTDILEHFKKAHIQEYKDIIIQEKFYGFPEDIRANGRNTETFKQFSIVRNDWLQCIKELNCTVDWVLSIDSDILIPNTALKKLISNNKDVCSILVNNMEIPMGYGKDCMNILEYAPDRGMEYKHILSYKINSVFSVDVTGACYLIKRSVLGYGSNIVKYGPHIQGEDCTFCSLVKQNGFGIFCDSTLQAEHCMKLS